MPPPQTDFLAMRSACGDQYTTKDVEYESAQLYDEHHGAGVSDGV